MVGNLPSNKLINIHSLAEFILLFLPGVVTRADRTAAAAAQQFTFELLC